MSQIKMTFPLEGKYLNQFHKESTERKLRKLAEWKKQRLDLEKELRLMEERHKAGYPEMYAMYRTA